MSDFVKVVDLNHQVQVINVRQIVRVTQNHPPDWDVVLTSGEPVSLSREEAEKLFKTVPVTHHAKEATPISAPYRCLCCPARTRQATQGIAAEFHAESEASKAGLCHKGIGRIRPRNVGFKTSRDRPGLRPSQECRRLPNAPRSDCRNRPDLSVL